MCNLHVMVTHMFWKHVSLSLSLRTKSMLACGPPDVAMLEEGEAIALRSAPVAVAPAAKILSSFDHFV